MKSTVINGKETEDMIALAVTQVHLEMIICRMILPGLIKCSKQFSNHIFKQKMSLNYFK